MKRLTELDLAQILAKNPHVRLNRAESPPNRLTPLTSTIHRLEAEKPAVQPRKYRNQPTVVDGVRYDSKNPDSERHTKKD